MVDTRATLNFVAANETVQLGLKLAVDGNKLKTEHAAPQSFEGAARDVPLKMGAWRGKVTLVAVPYDDFEVIHGLEFPANAKAVVVPHLGVVTICDETCLGKELSALQVNVGLQQGQATYLTTLVLNKNKSDIYVPLVVENVLGEFANVMSPELPRSQPLKQGCGQQDGTRGRSLMIVKTKTRANF
ncbi:hypothetical protein AMTRI_Chr01g105570 [Amborella trichopoda]